MVIMPKQGFPSPTSQKPARLRSLGPVQRGVDPLEQTVDILSPIAPTNADADGDRPAAVHPVCLHPPPQSLQDAQGGEQMGLRQPQGEFPGRSVPVRPSSATDPTRRQPRAEPCRLRDDRACH